VQLVTMVSTIANGGVYLPPHVLLANETEAANSGTQGAAKPSPLKVDEELPNPLPDGAHRVISALAAAQMRKMMEGVVLFGTGKQAQLNGYSSAGKTGTAQKIDPATHTYSKTMHVASFAGFAPVNNPVIAVAVVIDNPKGSYYGASVSAPVFAEVAQAALEYLGVQHDIDLQPTKVDGTKKAAVTEDDGAAQGEDIQALYEAANNLPGDDPQSETAPAQAQGANPKTGAPANGTADHKAKQATLPTAPVQKPAAPAGDARATANPAQTPAMGNTVAISEAKQIQVPQLVGLPVRKAIEVAAAAGFEVEIAGSGTVREQAPAAGTTVATGTKIAVKCAR
jgi:cell division protein FtsI (penicillin-binding protein 3)